MSFDHFYSTDIAVRVITKMGSDISFCASLTPQSSPLQVDTNCPLSIAPFSPECDENQRAICQSPVGTVSLESLRLDAPDDLSSGEQFTTMLTPRQHRSASGVSGASAEEFTNPSLHRRCDTDDRTDTSSLASYDNDFDAAAARPYLHRRSMSSGLDLLGLIRSGDTPAISALMTHININMHDLCAVHVAAMFGQVAVLQLLREAGGDLAVKDEFRRTACHWAALYRQSNVMKYLVTHIPSHGLKSIDVFGYSAEEYLQQDIGVEETDDVVPQSSDERILPENDALLQASFLDSLDIANMSELKLGQSSPTSSVVSSSQLSKRKSMKKRVWKSVKAMFAMQGSSASIM